MSPLAASSVDAFVLSVSDMAPEASDAASAASAAAAARARLFFFLRLAGTMPSVLPTHRNCVRSLWKWLEFSHKWRAEISDLGSRGYITNGVDFRKTLDPKAEGGDVGFRKTQATFH